MRCEDHPFCGHDICPDFDEAGNQLNMKCVCGATVPLNNRSSLCDSCLNSGEEDFADEDFSEEEEDLNHCEDGQEEYDMGDYWGD